MIVYKGDADDEESLAEEGKMEETLNLQRMQWRVVELEKLCRQMKGQMSRMVKHNHVLATPTHARPLPRLC